MKKLTLFALLVSFILPSCSDSPDTLFDEITSQSPSIDGRTEYLDSPYVTAGDRVYMVGHQNGSFPELGWHIPGEMGGIWNHPIKLMDGFDAELLLGDDTVMLNDANLFTNYPYANEHHFDLTEHGLEVRRWQFVPDHTEGLAVQYILRNEDNKPKSFTFKFTGYSDLRPTWLGERTNMEDGTDEGRFNPRKGLWTFKDSLNNWFVTFGADREFSDAQPEQHPFNGKGDAASLSYEMVIEPGDLETITFFIAGSYTSEPATSETFGFIRDQYYDLLRSKRNRYKELARKSRLTIPDKKMEQTFEWLKYNSDWLVRTVPEIGSGIGAGIPDYPWWFGVDSEYALKGYMAIGQTEPVYNTIALLDSVSNAVNGNGRIIHEMSTNGAVFNPGNINETPQFASLIWEVYRWNGDRNFLERYFPTVEKGLEWLMEERDENGNLFPDGFGMMEIHGLDSEMIDVASYTQRGFDDAAKMAAELGNTELALEYQTTANTLKDRINEQFWSEEFKSFADFIGTDEQAIHLIDDAIVRADTLDKPWAVEELRRTRQQILDNPSSTERPFVVHHNWVVNTPMEMGIADTAKALVALETAEKFVNPFGVFVTGIDRDESAGSDDGSFQGSKVFSYTGAVMTLPTGVQAVAENNYGRADKALNYLRRMTRTFSFALPGSMYEVSPDYGMMTQAWNIYSYAVPIVQQFFGVQPMASRKEITIRPQMPTDWDKASLENVKIADNEISLFYERDGNQQTLRVNQSNPDWKIIFLKPDGEEVVKTATDSFCVSWE